MNDLLFWLLAAVTTALGDSFVAFYLGGSLATGTFNPDTSDIDFVVITRDDLSDELVAALRQAHDGITASSSRWARKLEGLYIPVQTLTTRDYSTQRCAYLGVGGRFMTGEYQSDWIVQLHLVREHGIVLAGPDPKAVIPPVTPEELRAACAAIMRDWAPLVEQLERFDVEYQAYTVLTMCRVLYTLEHGAVASKAAVAAWVRERYGQRSHWVDLIDEAVAWRHGMRYDHLDEVLRFVRHTIERSTQVDIRTPKKARRAVT